MPVAAVLKLAPVTEELNSIINIDGSAILLQIELDKFEITTEERASVERGAVVVLPQSYEENWQIVATGNARGVPLDFRGTLERATDTGTRMLSVSKMEASGPAAQTGLREDGEPVADAGAAGKERHRVQVYCHSPCRVTIDQLLDRRSDVRIPVNTSQLSLFLDDKLYAHGSLLNYGRGGVLAVNELVESS